MSANLASTKWFFRGNFRVKLGWETSGIIDQIFGTIGQTLGTEPPAAYAEIIKEQKESKESWAKSPSANGPRPKWFLSGNFRVKLGFQNGIWNPGLCLCWGCVYLRRLDWVPARPCPRVGACGEPWSAARLRACALTRWRGGAWQSAARPAVSWAKQKGRRLSRPRWVEWLG